MNDNAKDRNGPQLGIEIDLKMSKPSLGFHHVTPFYDRNSAPV